MNYFYLEQFWEGSIQVTVNIRILKDGFKSLPFNYYGISPPGTPLLSVVFKDEYIKDYGSKAWDDRVKLLERAIEKTEQYIMKLRKDLSTY